MAGFTTESLEKRLLELDITQQKIQTSGFWIIHHRKHYKVIVQTWFNELKKG